MADHVHFVEKPQWADTCANCTDELADGGLELYFSAGAVCVVICASCALDLRREIYAELKDIGENT